jgi:hypothetical protein
MVLLLVLVGCGVAATPTVASHLELACPARGSHVLLSDRLASVYWFGSWEPGEYPEGVKGYWEGSAVYACAIKHHPLPVQEIFVYGDNVPPCTAGCLMKGWRRTTVLAGSTLAYATDSDEDTKYGSCSCESWGIVVRDLRTGRFLQRLPTGPHYGNSEGDHHVGVGPALAVVAKPDGSVAWMVENSVLWDAENFYYSDGQPQFQSHPEVPIRYELYVSDRLGERVLASGSDLDARSLALTGSTLRWSQAGKRYAATLH